jgi:hypothetical protein
MVGQNNNLVIAIKTLNRFDTLIKKKKKKKKKMEKIKKFYM